MDRSIDDAHDEGRRGRRRRPSHQSDAWVRHHRSIDESIDSIRSVDRFDRFHSIDSIDSIDR